MIRSAHLEELRARCERIRTAAEAGRALEHLAKMPPPTDPAFHALALNPRSADQTLQIEDALWPLSILRLPSADVTFEEVAACHQKTVAGIESAKVNEPSSYSREELSQLMFAANTAFDFLRWPQNRERVKILIACSPTLQSRLRHPAPRSPTIIERGFALASRIVKQIETRRDHQLPPSSEDSTI